ncbi:hypothetical protein [Lewinella sp. W8]|uniref:gliding motility protein GldB-related protein n=1 Tax=Lewinella sp. W8 TaxID=2528208 RepID=UPI001067944D|nr:hypothetical protein [Lewinella sp. W8]MTB52044.1 hypothetical protein [Lewinella sp. W8]
MELNVKVTVASLILVLSLAACSGDEEPPPPDVSGIDVSVDLLRYERSVMNLDTNDLAAGIAALDEDFGEFSDVYLTYIVPLRRGDFSPEEQLAVMKAFVTFPLIQALDSLVAERFTDEKMARQQDELEQALRYYKYYLPDAPLPDTLMTYLAQFELAALLYGEGQLAVGLDFFLGPEFDYQAVDARETIFSSYLSRTYTPEHMTEKLMRVLIDDYIPRPRAGRLIDYLVYEGKKLFLLDRVLPGVSDSILFEVSGAEMDWLRENETQIYAYVQKEKILYDSSTDLIRKYTQPAPYSPGMPQESPGGAVNYLGKRIVEAFVRANPKITMEELINIEDGQRILEAARYKPR